MRGAKGAMILFLSITKARFYRDNSNLLYLITKFICEPHLEIK